MQDHLWRLIELCKGSFCCYRAMNNPPGMFRLKVEIICIHMNIDEMTYWTDLLLIKWRINFCRTTRNVIRVTWNVACRVIEKWTTSMCKFMVPWRHIWVYCLWLFDIWEYLLIWYWIRWIFRVELLHIYLIFTMIIVMLFDWYSNFMNIV